MAAHGAPKRGRPRKATGKPRTEPSEQRVRVGDTEVVLQGLEVEPRRGPKGA